MAELMSYLSVERFGINSCERFTYICNNGLNKHAPQKKKNYVRQSFFFYK